MINVSLENETEWVIKGTISSDVNEIDLDGPSFRIEIKDVMEHYIKRETADEVAEAFEKDVYPTLSISNNEIKKVPVVGKILEIWFGDSPNAQHYYVTEYTLAGEYETGYIIDTNLHYEQKNVKGTAAETIYANSAYIFSSEYEASVVAQRLGLRYFKFVDYTLPVYSDEYYSNISTYNNSDRKSLIENGFQFWVNEDKKTLEFRMTARGKSSLNPDGYYDKLYNKPSGRVGFNIAICTISLDDTHYTSFNVTLSPKMKTSNIFRLHNQDTTDIQIPTKPPKECPLCGGTGIILKTLEEEVKCPACNSETYNMDRYAYPYYDCACVQDMLYVNNNDSAYSASYSAYWDKRNQKYKLESEYTDLYGSTGYTPEYAAITSAIIPSYLIYDTIPDVLHPGTESPRGFEFCYDEGVVSSYLLGDNRKKYCELPWVGEEYSGCSITILSEKISNSNTATITEDLNVTLITQTISVASSDNIEGKTVFFGTEV